MNKGKREEFPDNWAELRDLARENFKQSNLAAADSWTHLAGNEEMINTKKRNYRALDEIGFHLKTIHQANRDNVDTRICLLGQDVEIPIAVAPMSAGINDVCENVFLEIGEGSKLAGSVASIGYPNSIQNIKSIVSTGAPVFHIIKPLKELDRLIDLIKQAEDMNCFAVGIDVDSIMGLRVEGGKKLFDELCRPLTIEELKIIREQVKIPFIIKGIMSVEDAQKCLEIGANAIVVSNHAGYSLDYSLSSLEVLPKISSSVGHQMQIIFDSGVRLGGDVLKALALGADAVLIGQMALWGLAIGRREGLAWILRQMEDELKRTMVLTGVKKLSEADKNILVPLGDIGENILEQL